MPDDNKNTNGWNEWSRHVLKELERLNVSIENVKDVKIENIYTKIEELKDDIQKKIEEINVNIGQLNVKSTTWGAIGGAIPVAIGLAVYFITRG